MQVPDCSHHALGPQNVNLVGRKGNEYIWIWDEVLPETARIRLQGTENKQICSQFGRRHGWARTCVLTAVKRDILIQFASVAWHATLPQTALKGGEKEYIEGVNQRSGCWENLMTGLAASLLR